MNVPIQILGVLLVGFPLLCCSASFPSRAVRLVVPYAAGATPDLVARQLADKLSARYGQAVIVENKPGAGGAVAAGTVLSAPADGHTLWLVDNGQMAITPQIYKQLPFDPRRDLVPVTQVVEQPFLIWANKALGADSLKGVFTVARANPGSINYGTVGPGSVHHLCMASVARTANISLTHVPYKSAAAQLGPAMISNEVSLTCTSPVAAAIMTASGKVVPISSMSTQRLKAFPSVPTFSEATGFGDLVVGATFGIVAKTGTSAVLLKQIASDVQAAISSTDVVSRLESLGMRVHAEGPDAYAKVLKDDYQRYGEMVRISGAREQ